MGLTVIDLAAADEIIQLNGGLNVAVQSNFENVDLSGLTGTFGANITGTSTANTIVGSRNVDNIVAGGGADVITGGGGADTIDLAETTAARDTINVGFTTNGESAVSAMDVITGFATGVAATSDVLDFGMTVIGATNLGGGEAITAGGQFTWDNAGLADAAAVANLLAAAAAGAPNQATVQNGTFFFVFGGDTYVGELHGGQNAETVVDLVRLVGVTGMTTLTDIDAGGAGTLLTLSA